MIHPQLSRDAHSKSITPRPVNQLVKLALLYIICEKTNASNKFMVVTLKLRKALLNIVQCANPSIVYGKASAYLKAVMAMPMSFGPKVWIPARNA